MLLFVLGKNPTVISPPRSNSRWVFDIFTDSQCKKGKSKEQIISIRNVQVTGLRELEVKTKLEVSRSGVTGA